MTFEHPLLLLLIIPACGIAALIWRSGYSGLSPMRNRIALGLRIGLLVSIVLALAGIAFNLPVRNQAVVFLADRSASVASRQDLETSIIAAAAAHRVPQDRIGVVSTGGQSVVEQPVSAMSGFDGFQTSLPAGAQDYTNLQNGLELAGAILPPGYRRRVVLLSDGQQNVGDGASAARLLRSIGVRVDVLPIHIRSGQEVLVDGVSVPQQVRLHERFSLHVSAHSTVSTTAGLTIYRDRSLVLTRHIVLRRGENTFAFHQASLHPGFHSFTVRISPAVDTDLQNNAGSAFTQVRRSPKVLVIAALPSEAANVMSSLHATGISADLRLPGVVAPTLNWLQRFAAIVIVDTPAGLFDPAFLTQLIPYERDLGRGVVVIGGQESYGIGGYSKTPLETILPVSMALPKRKDLPRAAVGIIIEDLEEPTQVNVSKRAGEGVVNLLTQGDQVAVSDEQGKGFVVPLQKVTSKSTIDQAIEAMQPGDPQSYSGDLQAMYRVLRRTSAPTKHIILVGDGDAEDPTYQSLLQHIKAGGISVSTVATNGQGVNDWPNMRKIAAWGGGRYYQATNPSAIPKIFLREAHNLARSGIVPGKFYPRRLSPNPMIRDLHSMPPLFGYVATTPKTTGEIVLASKKLDPVLAAWQFGLGRSVAWTSDAAGLWSRSWVEAPDASRFWSDLVSWVLPAGGSRDLFVGTAAGNGTGQISVQTPSFLGANPQVTARVIGPDLRASTVQLQAYAPSRFRASFPTRSQGAYVISVQAHGSGHVALGQAGLDSPYSAEYRTTGTNLSTLQSIASAGGGSIIKRASDAWLNNLPSVSAQHSLANWFLLLALLLFITDIAVRRVVVDWRDLPGFVAAVRSGRTYVPAGAALAAPLQAVRAGRARRSLAVEGGQLARSVPLWALKPRARPGTVRGAAGNARTAGRPGPRPAAGGPAATSRAEPKVQAATSDESTVGALLAAKRKRG
ncbi:MAG: VWA domain-containing protein [Chloroflexota bacterium]